MTPQPQQEYFLITDNEMRLLMSVSNSKEMRDARRKAWDGVHSRPAPSSAHVVITETKNKITCDHCGKIVEYLNSWTYRNDDGIKRYLCSERCYDLESDKQHDATIRQQERERVLDKVISFCKSNDCVQATYGDQDCMSTTDSECVICFCESLRSREGGDE